MDMHFPAIDPRTRSRPGPGTSDGLPAGQRGLPARRPALAGALLAPALAAVVGGALPSTARAQATTAARAEDARPEIPHTGTEYTRVELHEDENVVELVIGPVELPDGMPHLRLPIQMMRMPLDGWLRGYSWRITDEDGDPLPDALLHHVNFADPDHRQLFDPTARRVLAAGRETTEAMLPPVVGIPFQEGTRYMVSAMFANATGRDHPEAYLHVDLHYLEEDRGLIRPHDVYPFYLDVMGPVGTKDFAVPPGRTVKAWEGSPAIDARILGAGGHLHDFATRLRLVDLTTGEVLWSTRPNASDDGRVHSIPEGRFWWRGGIAIRSDHRYRVEVVYENPGDEPAPLGGMGVVAGVVMPAPDARWPAFDRSNPAYREDLMNHVTAPMRLTGHGHGHGSGGDGGASGGGEAEESHGEPGHSH